MTRYVIDVSPDGQISVKTQNIHGPTCLESLEKIRKMAPRAQIVDSALTSDYFAVSSSSEARSTLEERA